MVDHGQHSIQSNMIMIMIDHGQHSIQSNMVDLYKSDIRFSLRHHLLVYRSEITRNSRTLRDSEKMPGER
jgi:hypothetical protein